MLAASLPCCDASFAYGLKNIGPHTGKRWHYSAHQSSRSRYCRSKRQHRPADADFAQSRQRIGEDRLAYLNEHHRERDSENATQEAEQHAFANHLPEHRLRCGAEREPNSEFSMASRGPHQQQIGKVHAGNQQNQGDGTE